MGKRIFTGQAMAAAMLIALAACGGGGSPTGPSGGGGGGGGSSAVVGSTNSVGAVGATITIGSNGVVSPSQVTVAVGQSVTFVNNDSRGHTMNSDPHPAHGNCPSINNIGFIGPGQSKSTFGFAGTGTCSFHDHNEEENNNLKGRIVIQ